ncbi:hypothetical protein KCP78_20760 [Salmonella enterica subsp. enterica]|nr:hypothetical protein KCP78_20760 [Salmonella enterica subsp. enterica]
MKHFSHAFTGQPCRMMPICEKERSDEIPEAAKRSCEMGLTRKRGILIAKHAVRTPWPRF